jgi:hypothetical protein
VAFTFHLKEMWTHFQQLLTTRASEHILERKHFWLADAGAGNYTIFSGAVLFSAFFLLVMLKSFLTAKSAAVNKEGMCMKKGKTIVTSAMDTIHGLGTSCLASCLSAKDAFLHTKACLLDLVLLCALLLRAAEAEGGALF